jgi:hypothetical protein
MGAKMKRSERVEYRPLIQKYGVAAVARAIVTVASDPSTTEQNAIEKLKRILEPQPDN